MSNVVSFPSAAPVAPPRTAPPVRPAPDPRRLLPRVAVSELERRLYRRTLGDGMSAALATPGEPFLGYYATRWAMADGRALRLTVAEARRLALEAEWAADAAAAEDRQALRRVARRWAWRAARA